MPTTLSRCQNLHRGLLFLVTLLLLPLIGGLYGALHDQLSYTVSPEYFTHFKYFQFGFDPQRFVGHRPTVAVIGFLATWWVGLFIAVFLAPLSLMFKNPLHMRRELLRATGITLGTAMVCSMLGLGYGWFLIHTAPPGWYLPEGLADEHSFLSVGSMHNMGYLGGVLGLCVAVTVMVWRKKRERYVDASTGSTSSGTAQVQCDP